MTLNMLIPILVSAFLGFLNAIILAKYNQAIKREEKRQDEIVQIKKDLAVLQRGYVTEDKLRVVMKEELHKAFQDYELRLINEGRLEPIKTMNRRKDDNSAKRQ